MKKHRMTFASMALITGAVLLLIFIIQRYTTLNLNFWVLFSYNSHQLADPQEDDYYKIERITNDTWNEIRYDPVNQFYLIAENEKITKLNNKGEVSFSLDLNEKDNNNMPDRMDYHRPSYFVVSWHGIYDLSKEKPYLEKFEELLNKDKPMTYDEWIKHFNYLYLYSDVVLWGYKKAFGPVGCHPIYFRIDGKWKILYSLKDVAQINSNHVFTKFRLNFKEDFIPDKSHKLFLLKDIQHNGAYSDYNSFDNSYDNNDYPEAKLQYGKLLNIKTLWFKKEVYNETPYSFIPSQFSGTVLNELQIGKSNFTFKTKGIRGAGFNFEPLKTFLYCFEVPEKFKTDKTLSFLYYKYPTNWNADNNAGIYIIRKKSNKD